MDENARFSDDTPEESETQRKEFVASLARGLAILSAFDLNQPQMNLTEVANKVGMTRASARRYLLTLKKLGYLAQEGRRFHLTPRVLDLGYAYMASIPVLDIITPVLEALAAATGFANGFSIVNEDEVIVLAHGSASRFIATGAVGVPRPVHCTASGRAILAFWEDDDIAAYLDRVKLEAMTPHTITDRNQLLTELKKIRIQGYAIVDQESELGRRAIAVPVFDAAQRLLGSILIVVSPVTTSVKELETVVFESMRRAADQIQQQLPAYN